MNKRLSKVAQILSNLYKEENNLHKKTMLLQALMAIFYDIDNEEWIELIK